MSTNSGIPAPTSIQRAAMERAALRTNPTIAMDAVIVEARRVATVNATEIADLPARLAVSAQGALQLAPAGAVLINSQGASVSGPEGGSWALHSFADAAYLRLEWWPNTFEAFVSPFELSRVDFRLGRKSAIVGGKTFNGVWRVSVAAIDERWRRVVLAQVDIPAAVAPSARPTDWVSLDLAANGAAVRFEAGEIARLTGYGRTVAGALRQGSPDERTFDPESGDAVVMLRGARGLSIVVEAVGEQRDAARWIAGEELPTASKNAMWRRSTFDNRTHGPYDPRVADAAPLDVGRNTDPWLSLGPVPGYGRAGAGATNATFTVPPREAGEARVLGLRWPHARWYVNSYAEGATIPVTLDLGGVPAADSEVQLRIEGERPNGTTLAFTLDGRNAPGDVWTPCRGGAALSLDNDGELLTGGDIYRYYRVTLTLDCALRGTYRHARPSLRALQIVERVAHATVPLVEGDWDNAQVKVDPMAGKIEIPEVTLSLLKPGPRTHRDLATRLASTVAPTRLELEVWARDTRDVTAPRFFVDRFRLESRTPGERRETWRWTGLADRLKAQVPRAVDAARWPGTGFATITEAVGMPALGTDVVRITVSAPAGSTPVPANAGGWEARIDGSHVPFIVLDGTGTAPGGTQFYVVCPDGRPFPAVGETVWLRDATVTRNALQLQGDWSQHWTAILDAAEVPARYRGVGIPARADDSQSSDVTISEATEAGELLSSLAFIAGGGVVQRRGRLEFVSLYTPANPVAVWDERHYAELETPTGMDRRTPAIAVKYGYDFSGGSAEGARTLTLYDADAIDLVGQPNLYDVSNAIPDTAAWWLATREQAITAGERLLDAGALGVHIWTVTLAHQWPWVEIGDAVTLVGDLYTGLDTSGRAIAGRTSALGTVVGKNLRGDQFEVFIPRLTAITAKTRADGAGGGPLDAIPAATVTYNVEVQSAVAPPVATIVATVTPPDNVYFAHMEYQVEAQLDATLWGTPARVIGSGAGPDAIPAQLGGTYRITPVTVSTAGARTTGEPTIITVATSGPARLISRDGGRWTKDGLRLGVEMSPETARVDLYVLESSTEPALIRDYTIDVGSPTASIARESGSAFGSTVVPVARKTGWLAVTYVPINARGERGGWSTSLFEIPDVVPPAAPTVSVSGVATSPTPRATLTITPTQTDGRLEIEVDGTVVATVNGPLSLTPTAITLAHSDTGGAVAPMTQPAWVPGQTHRVNVSHSVLDGGVYRATNLSTTAVDVTMPAAPLIATPAISGVVRRKASRSALLFLSGQWKDHLDITVSCSGARPDTRIKVDLEREITPGTWERILRVPLEPGVSTGTVTYADKVLVGDTVTLRARAFDTAGEWAPRLYSGTAIVNPLP